MLPDAGALDRANPRKPKTTNKSPKTPIAHVMMNPTDVIAQTPSLMPIPALINPYSISAPTIIGIVCLSDDGPRRIAATKAVIKVNAIISHHVKTMIGPIFMCLSPTCSSVIFSVRLFAIGKQVATNGTTNCTNCTSGCDVSAGHLHPGCCETGNDREHNRKGDWCCRVLHFLHLSSLSCHITSRITESPWKT